MTRACRAKSQKGPAECAERLNDYINVDINDYINDYINVYINVYINDYINDYINVYINVLHKRKYAKHERNSGGAQAIQSRSKAKLQITYKNNEIKQDVLSILTFTLSSFKRTHR